MKNLESKDLPFRTLEEFYKPTFKVKTVEGIKVFPKEPHQQGIFSTNPLLPSIIGYVSGLNEAKSLPRKIHNRQQYFSLPKSCKRNHEHSAHTIVQQMPQETEKHLKSSQKPRFETLMSNNITNRSTFEILSHKNSQQKILKEERNSFFGRIKSGREDKEKEMRFSFYNTIQKSDYFIKKFKEDSCLNERRTSKYQNMFRRNIAAGEILQLLNRSKQKLKHGI